MNSTFYEFIISLISVKNKCNLAFEPDADIGQISADFEMERFEIGSFKKSK